MTVAPSPVRNPPGRCPARRSACGSPRASSAASSSGSRRSCSPCSSRRRHPPPSRLLRWSCPPRRSRTRSWRSACAPGCGTACTAGRSPATPSTRSPAGSPARGPSSRSRASRPSTSPAACSQQLFGLASVAVLTASSAGHGPGAAPGGRRRPSLRRRPGPPRGAGPRPGDMSLLPEAAHAGGAPSPRIVAVHTVTFRQARQFVPILLPIGAATGFDGGTTAVVLLVVGITVLSLVTAGLTWSAVHLRRRPVRRRRHPGTAGPLRAHRAERPHPRRRDRGAGPAPAVRAGPGAHRRRGGGSRASDEELVIDGVPRAGGRPAAHRRPHPPAPAPLPAEGAAAAPVEEEFSRFDNRWLLYAPLVGSYLAVPLAAVGALFRLTDELPPRFQPDLDGADLSDGRLLLAAPGPPRWCCSCWRSVVGAAVVNWGFRLVRRGGSLIAVRGLITRRHTELEIDRIRGCTVAEGAGMRLARRRPGQRAGDRPRRRRPARPAAAAGPTVARRGRWPAGWSPIPGRCCPTRRPRGGAGSMRAVTGGLARHAPPGWSPPRWPDGGSCWSPASS